MPGNSYKKKKKEKKRISTKEKTKKYRGSGDFFYCSYSSPGVNRRGEARQLTFSMDLQDEGGWKEREKFTDKSKSSSSLERAGGRRGKVT